mgnify:CR=1 FL=1|tara:strand:+ start:3287 stop:4117 length:831 start_codon:yes stop_codon:yes gene_type:complete
MKNTLILGCGYIGFALLQYWNTKTRFIGVTTTTKKKYDTLKQDKCNPYLTKVNTTPFFSSLITKYTNIIVALAPKHKYLYKSTYLETAQIISEILKNHSSPKHIIYLSSSSVYGNQYGEWVNENGEIAIQSKHQEILYETEKIYLTQFMPHIRTTVLRLGGIYGPNREHITRLKNYESSITKQGNVFCNWIHQEDAVRAVDWILQHELQGIYNICSSDHPTKKKFYDAVAKNNHYHQLQWENKKKSSPEKNKRVSNKKILKTGFTFLHNSLAPIKK